MFGRGGEKPTQQALLMGATDAPSATTVETKPSVSFNPIAPEIGALRAVARLGRGRLALILIGAALFAGGLAFAINFLIAKDTNAARHGATAFAAALVHNNPQAAPQGAEQYVTGMRHYFGGVTSATLYRTHNHSVNTGNSADTRTYIVADVLIESRRGPAVLEVDFDNGSIGSDHVSSIRELDPKHAPGLTSAQHRRIEAAFARRGGKAVDTVTLSEATAPANAALTKAAKQLSCVQAANGDVTKMQRCTQP